MLRMLALGTLAACRINFDPVVDERCPASYSVSAPSSFSRYRIQSNVGTFAQSHASCLADAPGATHLAVFDSEQEMLDIGARLVSIAPQPERGRFYVGVVQPLGQMAVDANWLQFDGTPVDPVLWNNGEPQDLDDVEDEVEQVAVINATSHLLDVSGKIVYGAVCECDGEPLAPSVVAALAALP